jgi:5-methylcytosine-specific restriction endonuclease McrA
MSIPIQHYQEAYELLGLPEPRRRSPYYLQQPPNNNNNNNVSFRDCMESMSMAFLLGNESRFQTQQYQHPMHQQYQPAQYQPQQQHYQAQQQQQQQQQTQKQQQRNPNSFLVDSQGRSYRIGKNNRKIYKRKRVGERLRKVVAADQQWQCAHCEELLPASFEIDHVIPVSQGGSSDVSNLVALCPNCHKEKTTKEGIMYNF